MTDATPSRDACLSAEDAEALLQDSLNVQQRAACEAHLQCCPRCRTELAERRADNELLAALRAEHKRTTTEVATARTDEVPAIAGFDIIEQIHRGGQGVVYKARQRSPNRLVALKLLREDAGATVRERVRFEREIELAASLRHPNIVTVYETGTASGRRYLAMEYVDGFRLNEHLVRRRPDQRDRVRLLCKIGRAVQAAHSFGVIHRDLKPDNVLVDGDGEPRVLDFGVAKPLDRLPAADSVVTFAGEFLGTLAYAAPEQVSGSRHGGDVRTDVYSLGVLGYQMLTGRLPYELPGDLAEAIHCIRETPPTPPSSIQPRWDPDLETILLTALAKELERRYASVEALCRDLEHYLAGAPIDARRDSAWYVLRKNLRRHRLLVALTAAAFTLVIAFGVTMTVLYRQAERSAQRALRTQQLLQSTLSSINAWALGPDATLLEVLEQAENLLEAELAAAPDIEAELRYTIGLTCASVRCDRAAVRHLRSAYAYFSDHADAESERLAVCLANLGRIEGNVEQLRQAVDLLQRLHGRDARPTLLCRLDLAYALANRDTACQNEADAIFTEVGDLLITQYGPEHRYVARALHLRAWLLVRKGRFAEAEMAYRQALTIYLAQDIPDPYACEMFERYADLLLHLNRYADADRVLEQAAAELPPVFGRHWLTRLLWHRAQLAIRTGHLEAADDLYRQALGEHCLHLAGRRSPASEILRQSAILLLSPSEQAAQVPVHDVIRTLWEHTAAEEETLVGWACDLAELRLRRQEPMRANALLQEAERIWQNSPLVSEPARERVRALRSRIPRDQPGGRQPDVAGPAKTPRPAPRGGVRP